MVRSSVISEKASLDPLAHSETAVEIIIERDIMVKDLGENVGT